MLALSFSMLGRISIHLSPILPIPILLYRQQVIYWYCRDTDPFILIQYYFCINAYSGLKCYIMNMKHVLKMEKCNIICKILIYSIGNNAFYMLNVIYNNALSPAQYVYFNQFTVLRLCYSFNFVSFRIIIIIVLYRETTEEV